MRLWSAWHGVNSTTVRGGLLYGQVVCARLSSGLPKSRSPRLALALLSLLPAVDVSPPVWPPLLLLRRRKRGTGRDGGIRSAAGAVALRLARKGKVPLSSTAWPLRGRPKRPVFGLPRSRRSGSREGFEWVNAFSSYGAWLVLRAELGHCPYVRRRALSWRGGRGTRRVWKC